MLSHSLISGHLSNTMMDTNISLILKKGRPSEDCSSYRPIALLNVDRKILARRLEQVLPDLISMDQTGFIQGRNSCNNIRRLLFLSNPETSIVRIVEIIGTFGQFSGYKINYSKSEAMPLTLHTPLVFQVFSAAPFRWSPSGFSYLGIHITPSLSDLYKANFVPLIRKN